MAKADFGGSDAGVIAHQKRYAAAEMRTRLNAITKIAGDRYNWSLNDAR